MKQIIIRIFILLAVLCMTFGSSFLYAKVYELGVQGPAGGFIFYINLNHKEDGWRYLEVDSKGDKEDPSIEWKTKSVDIESTGDNVGDGKPNTDYLVNKQSIMYLPAKFCADLTKGGKKDWFLPSRGELDLINKNIHKKDKGGFSGHYLTSSVLFKPGAPGVKYFGGVGNNKVRCVRRFK
jgi:hypothetical protein